MFRFFAPDITNGQPANNFERDRRRIDNPRQFDRAFTGCCLLLVTMMEEIVGYHKDHLKLNQNREDFFQVVMLMQVVTLVAMCIQGVFLHKERQEIINNSNRAP